MDRSSLRPLVGISSCLKENGRGWHHTVGDKYVRAAIHAVGALPILIPAIGAEFGEETATIKALDRLIDGLDGVLLTGSPSNVEPHHYEGEDSRPGTAHDPARDATTLPLIRHSIDRGVPLFAICRGLQEVNVALGGSLHQLVHEVEGRRDHRSPKSPDTDVNYAPAHDVDIVEGCTPRASIAWRRAPGSRPRPTMARSRPSACPMHRPLRWRFSGTLSTGRSRIQCR